MKTPIDESAFLYYYFDLSNQGRKIMTDKKYTKQEITELADKSYEQCSGYFNCIHYNPVSYGHGDGTRKVDDKLFECVTPGCYYAAKLPWGDMRWCWFHRAKDKEAVDKLWSLTWAELVLNAQTKTR